MQISTRLGKLQVNELHRAAWSTLIRGVSKSRESYPRKITHLCTYQWETIKHCWVHFGLKDSGLWCSLDREEWILFRSNDTDTCVHLLIWFCHSLGFVTRVTSNQWFCNDCSMCYFQQQFHVVLCTSKEISGLTFSHCCSSTPVFLATKQKKALCFLFTSAFACPVYQNGHMTCIFRHVSLEKNCFL